ncbi:MAG: phosphotransferase [Saprospirales bacterium]|nr:phosphotransferase [Saprospirales bacterium]
MLLSSSLQNLYTTWAGSPPSKISPIGQASASHRKYFRVEGSGGTVIGTTYDNAAENAAFLYLSRHFAEKGLPVPRILAESPDQSAYLQEDLGDRSLYGELEAGGFEFTPAIRDHYQKVVALLPELQIKGHEGLDYSRCLVKEPFDQQAMLWDLTYFKYYFLKILDIPFDEYSLERDFQVLSAWLGSARPHYFMHRDFQSRNILLPGGRHHFIDYQGGRPGPLQYDLVSLLWQAKAALPHPVRQALLEDYLDAATGLVSIDREEFTGFYYGFALHRGLQVLGAYGLRGLVEKKSHFLESIPFALKNIQWLLEKIHWPVAMPELRRVMQQPIPIKAPVKAGPGHPLAIQVQSFSYRKGIPEDESGHGGGFVFDCRGIENPGRLDPFKALTGLSPEVIEFLHHQTRMDAFLEHIFAAVSETVENYIERDFDRLSISFGCTGGQHRSVYAAERMAEFLKKKYGIVVSLRHLEESNWPAN